MSDSTTYVGLDVHKKEHHAAVLFPGRDDPDRYVIPNESRAIRRLVRRVLSKSSGPVVFAYEAGVCGFALARLIEAQGVRCMVIAPSLTPVLPGRHVKTDRRDAAALAGYLRGGLLTEVHAPTLAQEAARDLCRLRLTAQQDLQRSRQRLGKFLLRRGLFHTSRWGTRSHWEWLNGLTFDDPLLLSVFREQTSEIQHREGRLAELNRQVEALSGEEPYRQAVGWLCCLRGVLTVTAMTILTEIHDFARFPDARRLMSYLGLTPSENSSGDTRRQGGVTKAGNRRARWILIESSWSQTKPPGRPRDVAKRRLGQPASVVRIAEKAQTRLYKRYSHLIRMGKPPSRAIPAVARELAGFMWAILQAGEREQAT